MEAILYARTSREEQRNGVEAQQRKLAEYAESKGWEATLLDPEHASGKTLSRRPILREALGKLDSLGEGGILVVTRLDRLSRSTGDFASILERSRRKGWGIAVLDFGGERLDTSTAMGKAMARVVMVIAELERELIGERTKEALAEVKANGTQLGHPSTVPAATHKRIKRLRREGLGFRAIASRLNEQGIPAPSGAAGRWHAASVRRHA